MIPSWHLRNEWGLLHTAPMGIGKLSMLAPAVVALSLLGSVTACFAYGSSPVSLARHLRSGHVIVAVQIEIVIPEPPRSPHARPTTAPAFAATVDAVLSDHVSVPDRLFFARGGQNPCDPWFTPSRGDRYLLFLRQTEGGSSYEKATSSYWFRPLERDVDYIVYRSRISELLKLSKLSADFEKMPEYLDWLVRCLECPATAEEGRNGLWEAKHNLNLENLPQMHRRYLLSALVVPENQELLSLALEGISPEDRADVRGLLPLISQTNPAAAGAIMERLAQAMKDLALQTLANRYRSSTNSTAEAYWLAEYQKECGRMGNSPRKPIGVPRPYSGRVTP